VYIPKPHGTGKRPWGFRRKDRVAQAAAKLVLEPIIEADLEDTQYAYRPKRNATRQWKIEPDASRTGIRHRRGSERYSNDSTRQADEAAEPESGDGSLLALWKPLKSR